MIDRHLFQIAGASSIAKRLAVLEVLQAFLIIGQAYALSAVLTKLWRGYAIDWLLLLTFALCFTGRQLIDIYNNHQLEKYSSKVTEDLRNQLLAKVFDEGQALVQRQVTW